MAHLVGSSGGAGSAHSSGSRGSSGLLPPLVGPSPNPNPGSRISGGVRSGLARLGTAGGLGGGLGGSLGGGLRPITVGRLAAAKPRGNSVGETLGCLCLAWDLKMECSSGGQPAA